MNLSPAEALVLLDPQADQGIQAAKVTFLALMAEGVLKLQEAKGRLFGKRTEIRVARQPAEAPPHVGAVLDAVRASRSGTIADIAQRLAKATNRFAIFVPVLVRPRLLQRGLLEERRHQEQRRLLVVFRRSVTVSTYHPTEAGAREQARLRGLLDQGPAIRAALDSDPSRAAAMAAALGPLLVLVPVLLPVLGQLAQAMGLAQMPADMGDSSSADSGWGASFDSAAADFGDSLDSALSDASSGSGSDSDGGDGGGSDGGGGE